MAQNSKNSKGYYTKKIIDKFSSALHQAMSSDLNPVHISNSNSKMGEVASVSLPPFLSCPGCCGSTCGKKCYAAKLANLRPNVLKNYAENMALLLRDPELYWMGVDYAVKGVRYFRFHVSGDIIDKEYFSRMVKVATDNPHCEILAFTKRYNAVNEWIDENGDLPANLHVLFSGWENLTPDNPHNLPETNVIMKGSEPDPEWKICGGNCFSCAMRGVGCWTANKGDIIAFNEH